MPTAESKRRWFQFRLRTLVVGVALSGTACACVTHEYRIVAARKAWFAEHRQRATMHVALQNKQPWIRRLLGDATFEEMDVRPTDEPAARELFPEALVDSLPGRWPFLHTPPSTDF